MQDRFNKITNFVTDDNGGLDVEDIQAEAVDPSKVSFEVEGLCMTRIFILSDTHYIPNRPLFFFPMS